jgi:hypothetical protein
MKFALLLSVGLLPFATAAPGFKEDVQKLINEQIIYKTVEVATPILAKQVHKTFESMDSTSLSQLPPDDPLNKPWFDGPHIPKILKPLLAPLHEREVEFKEHFAKRMQELYVKISAGAEGVTVKAIKAAAKNFFAVGDAKKVAPIQVEFNTTGLRRWVQKKLESLHATIMFELKPGMTDYMNEQRPMLTTFVQQTIKDLVGTFLGKTVAAISLKVVENFMGDFVSKQVDTQIKSKTEQSILLANTAMRKELYGPFWFLKSELKRINDLVTKK